MTTRPCDGCGKTVECSRYRMVGYPGDIFYWWCKLCAKGAEHCKA